MSRRFWSRPKQDNRPWWRLSFKPLDENIDPEQAIIQVPERVMLGAFLADRRDCRQQICDLLNRNRADGRRVNPDDLVSYQRVKPKEVSSL